MDNNPHIIDDELRLTPQYERFSVPEKLKRAENDALNMSRWDELCIGMAEDCLHTEETMHMHVLIQTDEATREQMAAYRKAILKTDYTLSFPDKDLLKHRFRVGFSWKKAMFGSAAIILLLLSIHVFRTASTSRLQNIITNIPELAAITIVEEPQQTLEPVMDKTMTPVQKAAGKILQPVIQKTVLKQPEHKPLGKERASTHLPKMKSLPAVNPVLLASAMPVCKELTLPVPPPRRYSTTPLIELSKVQGFFDRMTGHLIVGVNRVLNKETVVVKEFDLEGTMTYFAVHSPTIEMQRNYNKQ